MVNQNLYIVITPNDHKLYIKLTHYIVNVFKTLIKLKIPQRAIILYLTILFYLNILGETSINVILVPEASMYEYR